jgi:hypothetical protein
LCCAQGTNAFLMKQRGETLVVRTADRSFSLRLDMRRLVLPSPRVQAPTGQRFSAVHCLCPVYSEGIAGFKQRDPRLLLEWLAAHKAAG